MDDLDRSLALATYVVNVFACYTLKAQPQLVHIRRSCSALSSPFYSAPSSSFFSSFGTFPGTGCSDSAQELEVAPPSKHADYYLAAVSCPQLSCFPIVCLQEPICLQKIVDLFKKYSVRNWKKTTISSNYVKHSICTKDNTSSGDGNSSGDGSSSAFSPSSFSSFYAPSLLTHPTRCLSPTSCFSGSSFDSERTDETSNIFSLSSPPSCTSSTSMSIQLTLGTSIAFALVSDWETELFELTAVEPHLRLPNAPPPPPSTLSLPLLEKKKENNEKIKREEEDQDQQE